MSEKEYFLDYINFLLILGYLLEKYSPKCCNVMAYDTSFFSFFSCLEIRLPPGFYLRSHTNKQNNTQSYFLVPS